MTISGISTILKGIIKDMIFFSELLNLLQTSTAGSKYMSVIYFSPTDIVSVAIKNAAITWEKWSQFISLLANGDIN